MPQRSVGDLGSLIGRGAIWSPKRVAQEVGIPVTIRDIRVRYGREDALIEPSNGTGSCWVEITQLEIQDA